MKELPKPALAMLLILGLLFVILVVVQVSRNNSPGSHQQYLDKIDIQTGNPQPAGINLAP